MLPACQRPELGAGFFGCLDAPQVKVAQETKCGRGLGGEPEMRVMDGSARFALVAAACFAASLPVRADEQKLPPTEPAFTLRLNDLMVATQLRHFKLWYAGLVQNWPLANYELSQIRAAIVDTKRFYADQGDSKMAIMTEPTDELDAAIKAKDIDKFHKAYVKLTAACNACHDASGFGFIKIREPRLSPIETSPFTDESFSGN